MNVEKLIRCLLNDSNVTDTVSKLSSIQKSAVQEMTSRRVLILRRCLKFLHKAVNNGNYCHIPPVLKFVRMAISLDDWLISSSRIILPQLNGVYCKILTEADPGKHQSPGRVNAAISSRVKQDKDAMHALCSVFDLCVGFCDLVDDDNQRQLGVFLKCSAAVLFGSDFQKERDTLNETDYAMDELARYSSYALSNIMLTYPGIIPAAESILGKRLHELFKFLHSSPELGINKSLILMLRSLYQSYECDQGSPNKSRTLIDDEFSRSRSGRQSVLHLFQEIDLACEDADVQAENVSFRMYSGERDEVCFKSVKCSVQVKEQSGGSRRRVPFRCASIDWNRNSFAIHRGGAELPEYWPLFLVSDLDWRKGRKELHLQLEGRSGQEAFRIVIRFRSNSVSESEKITIEDRIRQTMERATLQGEGGTSDNTSKIRKVSHATMRGDDCRDAPSVFAASGSDIYHSPKEEQIKEGSQLSNREREKHIFSEKLPHKVYTYDSCAEGDRETFRQSSHGGSQKKAEQRFKTPSFETEGNRKVSSASSIYETDDSLQMRDANEDGGYKKPLPFLQSVESGVSSEESDKTRPSKGANHAYSYEGEPEDFGRENLKDTRFELSSVPAPSSSATDFLRPSHKLRSTNSYYRLHLANGSFKNLGNDVATDLQMKDSDVCFESNEKLKELSIEDEHLRQKLQSVVNSMLQWKQKQTSQVLHDTKVNITSLREKSAAHDHGLVAKFANGARKHSSLRSRKLTNMASRTRGVLLKTRKRLSSLREKLMVGRQQLKVLKTQSSTDIAHARDLIRKEREGLAVSLEQCTANSRRRSETRAKKSSVLQSLAKLLKEG